MFISLRFYKERQLKSVKRFFSFLQIYVIDDGYQIDFFF